MRRCKMVREIKLLVSPHPEWTKKGGESICAGFSIKKTTKVRLLLRPSARPFRRPAASRLRRRNELVHQRKNVRYPPVWEGR